MLAADRLPPRLAQIRSARWSPLRRGKCRVSPSPQPNFNCPYQSFGLPATHTARGRRTPRRIPGNGLNPVTGHAQDRCCRWQSWSTKTSEAISGNGYDTMRWRRIGCLVGLFLVLGLSANARDIQFGGYNWTVRVGRGGPGPNAWDEKNVWLDSATNLHLKISRWNGTWSCAEITMKRRLGFGRYQFQTSGRLDRFDDNVVLGLFNYPTGDVGPDGTHEIDIVFARWGEPKNPIGNFTVWPAERRRKQVTKTFTFSLTEDQMTHRFAWSRDQILFQSLQGYRQDDHEELNRWIYCPQPTTDFISQRAMPVHINLWLFRGLPPRDRREVEVIIRDFKFVPE